MAYMIPKTPREFEPSSQEGMMFEALEKGLPMDYYVIHSFEINLLLDNQFKEYEIDFIIFHPNKGFICLEAKSGHIKYEDGQWRYANGKLIHHGMGPYNQVRRNRHALMEYLENKGFKKISETAKFIPAVWLPSYTKSDVEKLNFPSEANQDLTLTREALAEPQKYIDKMFDIQFGSRITNISEKVAANIVNNVICPWIGLFPSPTFDSDMKKIVFHRLLKEQANVLNFLGDQKTAVINGAAGTGKTMVAYMKAKNNSLNGENVLFLCYNRKLRDFLAQNYALEKVDYYTIDGLVCEKCHTSKPDYDKFKKMLDDWYLNGNFPYNHIIIDEGQDFGTKESGEDDPETIDMLQSMHDIINDKENGSFYIFYDKLQNVQSKKLPKYIEDADCKLTLYRNCRNTENIAKTSIRPLSGRKPKLLESCIIGTPAIIHFAEDENEAIAGLDSAIDSFIANDVSDFVILSCKTEKASILHDKTIDDLYMGKYRFYTCRRFKGLEADGVILIDVDDSSFNPKRVMNFYVGSSRARLRLEIISTLTNEGCEKLLSECLAKGEKIKKPKKDLAKALNCSVAIKDV